MKRLLCLSVFAALTGCTKPVTNPLCDVAVKALTGAAQGVASALQCENVAAIANTLTAPVKEWALCAESQQGLIGNVVCPQVAKLVLDMGLSALPAEWKCKGGAVGNTTKEFIETQCKQYVTF